MTNPRLIVAITGATGALYGIRLLEALRARGDIETHLILSPAGAVTLRAETGFDRGGIGLLADVVHSHRDVGASIASGSFTTLGMVVAPCSMKTLGAIAHGLCDNLVSRAADVVLKERRRLVLLPRETPLNLAHLRNMVAVTEMGGIIAPPVPALYTLPQSIDEMVRQTVGRTLDLFGLDTPGLQRWGGLADRR